ncbi:MAG: HU family DNA-binding protein [Pseudomonadota bacterium]
MRRLSMTKAELIERVFRDNRPRKISRVAITNMVDTAFDLLAKGIKRDGKFTYPGFGAFNLRKRKEREGRNPKTGEKIVIKARTTIAFRAAPRLKASLR